MANLSDFELKIYELNYARNEHAHELRWKFMYAYVAGSLAFWGFIFSKSSPRLIPTAGYFLPLLFAVFGFAAYYALRQNMRARGQVMRELELKEGARGWQTIRDESPKHELKKPMVALGYGFWATMMGISLWLGLLLRST